MTERWILLNRYRGSAGTSPVHVLLSQIDHIDEADFGGSYLELPSGKLAVAETPERIIQIIAAG